MNQGLMGMFAGLGDGITKAADRAYENHIEEQRLRLRERLAGKARAEDRAFQQERDAANQEFQVSRDAAQNEAADKRLRLQAELGRSEYEDVTDEGGRLIGQRDKATGKMTPVSMGQGRNEAPWQVKAQIDAIRDQMKSIRKKDIQSPEDESALAQLQVRLNALTSYGADAPSMADALDQASRSGGETAPLGDTEPTPKPSGGRGLLESAMEDEQRRTQSKAIQDQIDALDDEAGKILTRLKARSSRLQGSGLFTVTGSSEQDIQAGQQLAQRLQALYENPESNLSERQRVSVVRRIMELQRAGITTQPN